MSIARQLDYAQLKVICNTEYTTLEKKLHDTKEAALSEKLKEKLQRVIAKINAVDTILVFEELAKAESHAISRTIIEEKLHAMQRDFLQTYADHVEMKEEQEVVVKLPEPKLIPKLPAEKKSIVDTSSIKFKLQRNVLIETQKHIASQDCAANLEMDLLILDIKIVTLTALMEFEKKVNAATTPILRERLQRQLDQLEKDLELENTITILEIQNAKPMYLAPDQPLEKRQLIARELRHRWIEKCEVKFSKNKTNLFKKMEYDLLNYLKPLRLLMIAAFNALMKRANDQGVWLLDREVGLNDSKCDDYDDFRLMNGGEIIFEEANPKTLRLFAKLIARSVPEPHEKIIFLKFILIVLIVQDIKIIQTKAKHDLKPHAELFLKKLQGCVSDYVAADVMVFAEEAMQKKPIEFWLAFSLDDLILQQKHITWLKFSCWQPAKLDIGQAIIQPLREFVQTIAFENNRLS